MSTVWAVLPPSLMLFFWSTRMPHVAPPTLLRAGPPHKSHRGQWSHQLSNNGDHQGRCKVGKNKNINKYSSRNATLLLQHRFNRESETYFSHRTQIRSFLVLVTHTDWKSQSGLSFCKLSFLIWNYFLSSNCPTRFQLYANCHISQRCYCT